MKMQKILLYPAIAVQNVAIEAENSSTHDNRSSMRIKPAARQLPFAAISDAGDHAEFLEDTILARSWNFKRIAGINELTVTVHMHHAAAQTRYYVVGSYARTLTTTVEPLNY
jgi:hypothetical protein